MVAFLLASSFSLCALCLSNFLSKSCEKLKSRAAHDWYIYFIKSNYHRPIWSMIDPYDPHQPIFTKGIITSRSLFYDFLKKEIVFPFLSNWSPTTVKLICCYSPFVLYIYAKIENILGFLSFKILSRHILEPWYSLSH